MMEGIPTAAMAAPAPSRVASVSGIMGAAGQQRRAIATALVSPWSLPLSQPSSTPSDSSSQAQVKSVGNGKWLILAVLPSFFGLMGLGQLYQGKKTKGLAFLVAGIVASILSSWYLLLPNRIDSFLFGGTLTSSYSLSLILPMFGSNAFAGRLSLDMLGVVVVIWGLQLFDAMGPIFNSSAAAAIATPQVNAPSWNVPTVAAAGAQDGIVVSASANNKLETVRQR